MSYSIKENVIRKLKSNGVDFKDLSIKERDDIDIVKIAINIHPRNFLFISERLKKDKDLILYAINRDNMLYLHLDSYLKKDNEIVLAALRKNIMIFNYCDKSFLTDRKNIDLLLNSSDFNGVNKLLYLKKIIDKNKDLADDTYWLTGVMLKIESNSEDVGFEAHMYNIKMLEIFLSNKDLKLYFPTLNIKNLAYIRDMEEVINNEKITKDRLLFILNEVSSFSLEKEMQKELGSINNKCSKSLKF
jgi:hypothetical protein